MDMKPSAKFKRMQGKPSAAMLPKIASAPEGAMGAQTKALAAKGGAMVSKIGARKAALKKMAK